MNESEYVSKFSPGNHVNRTHVLVRPLGVGSLGEVWEARHCRNQDRFALKILRHDRCKFAERFNREYSILSRARHPAVVACHARDVVTDRDGLPFLIMELVEGESLARILRKRRARQARVARAVSPQKLWTWLDPVFDALEYFERAGIVHRDIKPGNIVVSAEGRARILDLSLGKQPSVLPPVTASTVCGGTHPYSASEQFKSLATADSRADTFAISAVMAEALMGCSLRHFSRPDDSLDLTALAASMRGGPMPDDPPSMTPGANVFVPTSLALPLLQALSPDPKRRPHSVRELRRALQSAGGGDARTTEQPVSVRSRPARPVAPSPAARLGEPRRVDRGVVRTRVHPIKPRVERAHSSASSAPSPWCGSSGSPPAHDATTVQQPVVSVASGRGTRYAGADGLGVCRPSWWWRLRAWLGGERLSVRRRTDAAPRVRQS